MIAANSQTLRFGMVGAGGIAQAYAQSFPLCERAKLVAIADVRREAAEAVASAAGALSFASCDEMCGAVDLDAVVVCTPPATHPEICIGLMTLGIPVLCEKPLAVDSSAAREMIDAGIANNVKFTMASKFRYVDDVIKAKSIVTSGILGEVMLFENTFAGHVDMSARWNSDPDISGGGVLIDNGTHSVDIMRYFLGPVVELQVVEGKRIQRLTVEDTVRMFVRTAEDVMGSIDLSWSMNKEQPNYISIYGSNGTVLVGWKQSQYRRSHDDEWIVFGNGYNKFQAFRNQIDNFARAIRGEEALLITPNEALASVEVIETAYESLRQNKWQAVNESSGCTTKAQVAETAGCVT